MFSLHICHKSIELLSLIESDSLLTLIYVLVDNVSCYEYPAGIEHSVRVKNTANYFYSLSHTGSYSGNCVTLQDDLLCFHSCSLGRGSSGGLQSEQHKTALRVQCRCSQLQQVGTGSSMCVSTGEGVPFWVTSPLAAGAVPGGRVLVTGSHSLVLLRGRCKGVT